jgi:tetratricopeptide (TPR) repeat protein
MLAHYGRGIIAYDDKNWDEALAYFKDAQIAAPNRPETLYYLALTFHRKGDHASALPLMEHAQALLEAANDKRRADAGKWVRELQRLAAPRVQVEQPGLQPAFRPLRAGQQPQLPLPEDTEQDEDEE